MPYSVERRCLLGDDAAQVRSWAATTLATWLASRLNDGNGAYATLLSWVPAGGVFVSADAERARSVADGPSVDGPVPTVLVTPGALHSTNWRFRLDGELLDGQRHDVELLLDSAVSQAVTPESGPGPDAILADCVLHCLTQGRAELDVIGLCDARLRAPASTPLASSERNPLVLHCFVRGV